ncbi:MAG: FAD-dependent oxidoreductase, partial [Acidobacteriota bacterium]
MTRQGTSESGSYDVVILGGGLAGLTLARHLLLDTDRRVLLVERRTSLPPERQKVGESSVQLAGYYLSKVLDLEEYLNRAHLMKYNLRFYWPTAGRENRRFEDYGAAYIRGFSNVASYQLDRNRLEAELLRLNLESERFTFEPGIADLDVELAEDESPHAVRFRSADGDDREIAAGWVVDTTGRRRFLARRMELERPSEIRHGAFFWWVDGLVDVEKLTDRSRREVRLRPERSDLGHLPAWLATNHFCAEGLWFWVIPLHGKTSLGLVYDSAVVPH